MLRRAPVPVSLVLAIAFAIAGAGEVAAQDYARTGFYFSAGGSWASPSAAGNSLRNALGIVTTPANPPPLSSLPGNDFGDVEPRPSKSDADVKDSFGADVRIGYRASEYMAVETRLQWLNGFNTVINERNFDRGDTDPSNDFLFADQANFRIQTFTWTIDMKVYAAKGRIQPYALMGVGIMWGRPTGDINRNAPQPVEGLAGFFDNPPREDRPSVFTDPATRRPGCGFDPTCLFNPAPTAPAVYPNLSFPAETLQAIREANDRSNFISNGSFDANAYNQRQQQLTFAIGQFEDAFVDERNKFEIDESGPAIRGGLGVELYLTEHWAGHVEGGYVGVFGNVADLDYWYVSQGVTYRF